MEAYRESRDWKNRAEELADSDDTDITEEEVEAVCDEMRIKLQSSCYHTGGRINSLPDLLSKLTWLHAEWNYLSDNGHGDDDDEDMIRKSIYGHMANVAREETAKIQYIMEEYL